MADQEYYQFPYQAPPSTDILLHAADSSSPLYKCNISDLIPSPILINPQIAQMRIVGSPFLNLPLPVHTIYATGNSVLSNGAGNFIAVYLPACTVKGIYFVLGVAGNFTANNFSGFALYSLSGSTITSIAITTNNPNFFKGAVNFWAAAPFTSTVTVTAGIYYIGALYSASAVTTAPQLWSIAGTGAPFTANNINTASIYMQFQRFSITTLAGSYSANTIVSNSGNFMLTVPYE